MNILLIGGPRFLGYALIEAAQARGHQLTLFNRGRTFPERFPDLDRITGDRDEDLSLLAGRRWDAVVDTCGYFPRSVRASTGRLRDAVDHYTFISSISVYDSPTQPGFDETAPVSGPADESATTITGENYGALKARCEEIVLETLPGRSLVVRPGLIVGPHDPSDRFTYWPVRFARGGRILAPHSPEHPCQVIDVRDLAAWLVALVEDREVGTFNATSEVVPMGAVFAACRQAAGVDAALEWVPEEFLLAEGVSPWIEVPLWLPGQDAVTMQASVARAVQRGLAFRPLVDTARDTLSWALARPADHAWRAGLTAEKEAHLLARWDETRA